MRYALLFTVCLLLIAAPARCLLLAPTMPEFLEGSDVEFTATNDGSTTVELGSSVPYYLVNIHTNEVISFLSLPIMTTMPPGATKHFVIRAGDIEPGTYRIHFHYYDEQYESHEVTVLFTLTPEVPTRNIPMSVAKARYR